MEKKFVPMEKRSKKEQREYNRKQRGVNGFNTGTRVMKTPKHRSRAEQKDAIRKGKEI